MAFAIVRFLDFPVMVKSVESGAFISILGGISMGPTKRISVLQLPNQREGRIESNL